MLLTNEKIEELKANQVVQAFFAFIYERQMIYYKKEVLKLPRVQWTKDIVLRLYKFTNVYRELDTGTKFLRTCIEPHCKDFETYFLNLFLYRMFNLVDSWRVCVPESAIQFDKWDPQAIGKRYNRLKASGSPIFTNCHMIPPMHGFKGETKAECLMNLTQEHVVEKIDQIKSIICESTGLEEITRGLQNMIPSVGPFLGYEISTDLTHERIGLRTDWNQIKEDWTNPGPGAQRGLSWIYPNRPKKMIGDIPTFNASAKELRDVQPEIFATMNTQVPFLDIAYQNSYLGLRDIEHSLCEFDKYWRTVTGKSKPKNFYKPRQNEL